MSKISWTLLNIFSVILYLYWPFSQKYIFKYCYVRPSYKLSAIVAMYCTILREMRSGYFDFYSQKEKNRKCNSGIFSTSRITLPVANAYALRYHCSRLETTVYAILRLLHYLVQFASKTIALFLRCWNTNIRRLRYFCLFLSFVHRALRFIFF